MLTTLLFAAAVAAAEPAEKPWPQKGDTVFVSASLVLFKTDPDILHPLAGSNPRESPIAACLPLRVYRAWPKREMWIMRDPSGGEERLDGPWIPRMHRIETECRERLTSEGEPVIVRNDWVHRIIPPSE